MIWLAILVILLGASGIFANTIREMFMQPVDRCERASAYLLFLLGLILLAVTLLVKP